MYLGVAVSLFWIFLIVRNNVAYENRIYIMNAISNYKLDVIVNHYFGNGTEPSYLVDYDDMEAYFKTFMRFWDFSPKHILSDEKYSLVKDYMSNSE